VETFEELDLHDERLGERRWFLKENEEYKAMLLDGAFLDIVLPPQIPLKVLDTAPPVRGGSDTAWKEAKLERALRSWCPCSSPKERPFAWTLPPGIRRQANLVTAVWPCRMAGIGGDYLPMKPQFLRLLCLIGC